ncbi:MAG TPA: CBS domain-containing protein [Opitutaceae bacterium]
MKTPVGMLLSQKGSILFSVAPSVSVADAVRVMNEHKIGSIVVLDGKRLVGIFTERDVLTRVVAAGRIPQVTRVNDVMTGNVITITPETTIEAVMELFTHKRCRHLPVLDGGVLVGLISIGDVMRWLIEAHRSEAESLRHYISGEP